MKFYVSFLAFCLSFLFAATSVAQKNKTQSQHHDHEAHVHGSAKLAIAFDGLQGRIEFKAAAEGIMGFEHAARSPSEQKALSEAKAKFEKIGSMIQFEPALGCHFQPEKIDIASEDGEKGHEKQKPRAEHANFIANWTVTCQKPIEGSKLKIDFTSFPKLNDLDVAVLAGDLQKSAEAKKQAVTIELSK